MAIDFTEFCGSPCAEINCFTEYSLSCAVELFTPARSNAKIKAIRHLNLKGSGVRRLGSIRMQFGNSLEVEQVFYPGFVKDTSLKCSDSADFKIHTLGNGTYSLAL